MKLVVIFILRCLIFNNDYNAAGGAEKHTFVAGNLTNGIGKTFQKQTTLHTISSLRDVINRFHGIDVYSLLEESLLDPQFQFPNVSRQCGSVILTLAKQINISNPAQLITLPVTKMLDSWGKIPERVLLGNLLWLGAYDECSAIPDAKYCMSGIKLWTIPEITYGSCFPKQCTNVDVAKVMYFLSQRSKGVMTHHYSFCDNPVVSFSTGAIITIVIMAFLLLLCLIGTLVEIAFGNNKNEAASKKQYSGIDNDAFEKTNANAPLINEEQVNSSDITTQSSDRPEASSSSDPLTECSFTVNPLINERSKAANTMFDLVTCFSLLKNTRAILSTRVPKGAITSINGIRVISMTWVIVGHYFVFTVLSSRPDNILNALNIVHRFTFLAIGNAYVSVDSFFVLSGFLVSYLTLKKVGEKGIRMVDILLMYLHRYIRLTPTLALVILFWTNVFPLTLTGPRSMGIRQSNIFSKTCQDYWWSTLLYFNNFYPKTSAQGCISWTWYLANDFQFYVVSPFIMLLMLLIQKVAPTPTKATLYNFIIIMAMCFVSMLTTGIITGYFDLPALMTSAKFPGNPRIKQADLVMDRIYTKPYTRITPYLVGILLGYLISKDGTLNVKHPKLIAIIGWISATVLALLVIYGPWQVYKLPSSFFNDAENIMYSACYRFAWGCAVAWVIYACHNKYGGLVDAFLSWKVWIPLSRLTYSAYLLHLLVLSYYMVVLESSYHYQDSFLVSGFISATVLSYACAFVLAVCVEYPILNLEKMVFKR